MLPLPTLYSVLSTGYPVVLVLIENWNYFISLMVCVYICSTVSFHRTTPKTQYTGCSVHENNNGQAAFENPMYNTNAKAVEGKAVRFDPNLNTVCTMVWGLIILTWT